MAALESFDTPANQQDFPDDPEAQKTLNQLWSTNVHAFCLQAITGNPWTATYASNQTSYFDPLVTDISQAKTASIFWNAFPGRIKQYLGKNRSPKNPYGLDQDALNEFADSGTTKSLAQYPTIPKNDYLCPQVGWSAKKHPDKMWPYGPWGPRGWQDEYCEWSVTRNDDGVITRVDFTCENPEYWYTLWRVSPERAAEVYQSTLNAGAPDDQKISVTVDDLTLKDSSGKAVIDPSTGRPAYNPLNKWNAGTVSVRGQDPSGGAMHLTSTPNTIQTETALAAGATVQRPAGKILSEQTLICCAKYGQIYRHSDPHIGAQVNSLVVQSGDGYRVSLANPPGLYIQTPSFYTYGPQKLLSKLGSGASFADCWSVVRGHTGKGGDHILHAVFQLPESWVKKGITMDQIFITAGGKEYPIKYGSQIAETILMGIFGWQIKASEAPAVQPCVGSSDKPLPMPIQMMHASLWNAYYRQSEPNPMNSHISLASNSVIVPVIVPAGSKGVELALTYASVREGASVSFPPPSEGSDDVVVTGVSAPSVVHYAPPGNSFPSENQLITFTIDVHEEAEQGLRSILLTNPDGPPGVPAPAFLLIVPPGQYGTT